MTSTAPPSTAPHGFARRLVAKAAGDRGRGLALVEAADGAGPEERATTLDGMPAVAYHGFGWLDDLAALGTVPARGLAQAEVLAWLSAHPDVPVVSPPGDEAPQWRPDITGRRLLAWAVHGGMILPGLDRAASTPFFNMLHAQLAFLAVQWQEAGRGLPRIEALAGLALGALSLKEAESYLPAALEGLTAEAARLAEGVTARADDTGEAGRSASRVPQDLLDGFTLFSWVAEASRHAGHPVPTELTTAIEAILPVLLALRHADGAMARFHGGGRGRAGQFEAASRGFGAAARRAQAQTGLAMGYARLARGQTTVIVDAAAPPSGPAAAHAHASTLAFEMTVGTEPVVVNCGSGRGIGSPWARAGRATPSHSTLSLTGLSSARLLAAAEAGGPEFLTDLPGLVWAGTPVPVAVGDNAPDSEIVDPANPDPANPDPVPAPDAEGACPPAPDAPPEPAADGGVSTLAPFDGGDPSGYAHLLAGHDGYRASHGLLHTRELWLSPDGHQLAGEDSLLALNDADRALLARHQEQARSPQEAPTFDIRFHLHPDMRADQRDDEILLTTPAGVRWLFRHDRIARLSLEASAFMEPEATAPVPCWQIVLHAPITTDAAQVGWTFLCLDPPVSHT